MNRVSGLQQIFDGLYDGQAGSYIGFVKKTGVPGLAYVVKFIIKSLRLRIGKFTCRNHMNTALQQPRIEVTHLFTARGIDKYSSTGFIGFKFLNDLIPVLG